MGSCAEVRAGGRRDNSEEKNRKKVSKEMAATEFLVLTMFMSSAHSFCWKPNVNPFMGAPNTERIDLSTVRVNWDNVFPKGSACEEVDFLIKSHPLDAPSNYKLSDLTLKGKRTATLAVPKGKDFIFQVIARENKGAGIGIEYAYSRPATSLANPSREQVDTLRQSIWLAGDTGTGSRSGLAPPPALSTVPPPPPTRYPPPTPPPTRPPPPPTTPRTYIRPSVRSLEHHLPAGLRVGRVRDQQQHDDDEEEDLATPWYVYECVPLLKNLAGFRSDRAGGKSNSVLTQFIKHMNKATLSMVGEFIGGTKKCDTVGAGVQQGIGHLVEEGGGQSQCCSTPWGGAAGPQPVCYQQFARCDGHCIPHDWVDDGWPDCLDGADEADLTVDGKVMPFQLGCVYCAGVILPAGFLCIESSGGLTRECVEKVMGPGQCNVCIAEYLTLP